MNATNKLLDKAKEVCGSDRQVSIRLNVTSSLIGQWRSGRTPMPEDRVASLARIARENAGDWQVLIAADQAEGDARRAWLSVAQRLGIAACLVMTILPMAGNTANQGITEQFAGYALCEIR